MDPVTPPKDDWRNVPDRKTKKRIQNRVAQRSYRLRMKTRLDELQAKVTMHEQEAEARLKGHTPLPTLGHTQWSPSSPYPVPNIARRGAYADALQQAYHDTIKRKRALSDSEYGMICDFGQENLTHGMLSSPNEAESKVRACSVEDPRLTQTNDGQSVASPSLDPESRSSQTVVRLANSVYQSSMSVHASDNARSRTNHHLGPAPLLDNPQAQLYHSPLGSSGFTDFSASPAVDDFLGRDSGFVQSSTPQIYNDSLLTRGTDFVNNLTLRTHGDASLSAFDDIWTARLPPPMAGFQASSHPLTGLQTHAVDPESCRPLHDFGRSYDLDAAISPGTLPKPQETAPVEHRLRYVIDQAKSVGFHNFDDAITTFYTSLCREPSTLDRQSLARGISI